LKLFNIAYNTEAIPNDWQKGIICLIRKREGRTDCGNYRGITLLSHAGKLYWRIIENRLPTHVEGIIGEWQHGFRPGKCKVDLILTIQMIFDYSMKKHLVELIEKQYWRQ